MIQHQPRDTIRQAQAANDYKPSRIARILFGEEGDWFDRHQGLTLAIVVVLMLVGSVV